AGGAKASAAKAAAPAATEATARKTRAKKADQPAASAGKAQADGDDQEFEGDDMASLEADVAAFADGVDLDDQTPAMGDSVHTYLKSIGRTSLLTAEQ